MITKLTPALRRHYASKLALNRRTLANFRRMGASLQNILATRNEIARLTAILSNR